MNTDASCLEWRGRGGTFERNISGAFHGPGQSSRVRSGQSVSSRESGRVNVTPARFAIFRTPREPTRLDKRDFENFRTRPKSRIITSESPEYSTKTILGLQREKFRAFHGSGRVRVTRPDPRDLKTS